MGPVVGWGLLPLIGCSDNGCGLPVAPRDWEEEEEEEDGEEEEEEVCSRGAVTGWDWESPAPVAPPPTPPPATAAEACVVALNGC